MTSLLKEFAAYGDTQSNLKTSDGSDAGRNDITSKPIDVKFNLMRNAINTDGVTGSDVNDYLERAHELNDEVETVGFAVEDDEGGIIKVYVNAQQAGEFEEEMSKILGLDDDVEAAINQMAQKFDIVDVVWPEDPLDGSENEDGINDPDADLTLDSDPDAFSLEDPAPEDEAPAADAEADPDAELGDTLPADDDDERPVGDEEEAKPAKKSLMKDVAGGGDAAAADDSTPAPDEESSGGAVPTDNEAEGEEDAGEENAEAGDEEEPVEDEEELEPVLNADGSQKLDKDGNPVMRKKKKEKSAEPEVTEEGVRDELLAHVAAMAARGNKGKFYIEQLTTGVYGGPRKKLMSREGRVFYFTDRERALAEAERLAKHKNRAGATASFKFAVRVVEAINSIEGESDMIGAKFLERVLEAKDTDGVNDGLNIPLDSQQKLLVNRMKRPVEKQLVAMYALAGIWGRLLAAVDGIEDRVREAGDTLRKNASARKAFGDFYKAFAAAKGYGGQAIKESVLTEAKLKRGSALQKKFETVLVALGLPEDLVATDGPGAVGPALFKATKVIDADGNLQNLLNKLATRLGITGMEANAPLDEPDVGGSVRGAPVREAVDVGQDEFAQKVVALCQALGVPEKNLQFQRSMLVKGLREKRMSLTNRGMIEQRMDALLALVEKGTRQQPQAPAAAGQQANESIGIFQARQVLKEAQLTEAFGDLEALTKRDFEVMNIDEPEAGPAMAAQYEGNGNHEETILVIAVDPDADNQGKPLCVSIDGPWDGVIHRRYFTNDKPGYKAALEYANMLRTVNLKTGGRPKGWKDGSAEK